MRKGEERVTQNDNKSTDALEKNGEKNSNERDGGDRVETVKFLKPPNLFSVAANAFLVSSARRSSNLPHSDNVYWRCISSGEISRVISATDFYAAITPRFSFLFSTSGVLLRPFPYPSLLWKRKVGCSVNPYVTSSVPLPHV